MGRLVLIMVSDSNLATIEELAKMDPMTGKSGGRAWVAAAQPPLCIAACPHAYCRCCRRCHIAH